MVIGVSIFEGAGFLPFFCPCEADAPPLAEAGTDAAIEWGEIC